MIERVCFHAMQRRKTDTILWAGSRAGKESGDVANLIVVVAAVSRSLDREERARHAVPLRERVDARATGRQATRGAVMVSQNLGWSG